MTGDLTLTEWARETVRRTRLEQGLSPTLTDQAQLGRLAILFDPRHVESEESA